MARRKGRLKWLLGGVVILAGAVTAFFVYYHPPMRLMPAPLVFQEAGLTLTDLEPALSEGSRIGVFYAASRLPVGPREARIYTVAPDSRLHLGHADLRIGEDGTTLTQIYEWTTRGGRDDRPYVHLERMREYASLSLSGEVGGSGDAMDPDAAAWFDEINRSLALSRHKNILVYVHGANTTVERGTGQGAMLRHFTGRNAVVVVFVWPTAENFLRYSRDIQTAYGAAPRLVELIALLAAHTEAENIDVFTYSAGGTVGSDALGRLPDAAPEAAARLGEVIHAAPDADQARFLDDLARYAASANRVTAIVNMRDSALRLAAVVNRGARAGRPDIREISEEDSLRLQEVAQSHDVQLVQIHPANLEGMGATSHTFWYDDPWVSNDVLVTLLFNLAPEARQLDRGTGAVGAPYWTIPPDYPARLDSLLAEIRQQLRAAAP